MRLWQGETVGHTGEAAEKVSVIFFTCIFMQYVMPFYLVLHNEFYKIERLLKSENRVFRCALRDRLEDVLAQIDYERANGEAISLLTLKF